MLLSILGESQSCMVLRCCSADEKGIGVSQKLHEQQALIAERTRQHEERKRAAGLLPASAAAAGGAGGGESQAATDNRAPGGTGATAAHLSCDDEGPILGKAGIPQGIAGGQPEQAEGKVNGTGGVAAARAGEANGGAQHARFDSFVGTIEYMAPEVVDKRAAHSFSVDFWVFGVMVSHVRARSKCAQRTNRLVRRF